MAMLVLAAAMPGACVPGPAAQPPAAQPPAAQPSELRALHWTGTAEVYPPGRTLRLGVETSLTPFASARSDTWLIEQGRASLRSLIVTPNGGWLERGGIREAMPPAMLHHERQQYAVYGQMQLALMQTRRGAPSGGTVLIRGDGQASVDTLFRFDRDGRLVGASNVVDDPQTPGATIAQQFTFSGEVRSGALRWPQRIAIAQDGAPYFLLEIASFEAK